MRLIVGLGNPGKTYAHTRHNVGFMLLDTIVQKFPNQWTNKKPLSSQIANLAPGLVLAKPTTFMNKSGLAVKKLLVQHHTPLANLYVAHDDLDLPLGEYKIQFAKGPHDHKGLNSIYKALNTQKFWHIRIGVDNRSPHNRLSGEDYVLQNFTPDELEKLNDTINKKIIAKLKETLDF